MLRHCLIIVAATGVLSGCATLTEEGCQTASWQTLGQEDGARGFRKERVNQHVKACARHEIAVDQASYLRGWAQGIPQFCTPQNGYDQGIKGRGYRGSCPPEIAGAFEAAYRPAKRLTDAERLVQRLSQRISQNRAALARLRAIDTAEAAKAAARVRDRISDDRFDLIRARQDEANARQALFLFLRRTPEITP